MATYVYDDFRLTFTARDDGSILGRVGASFRPHVVDLQSADASRDPLHLWFSGTVEGSEFQGEFTRYRVRAGHGVIIADVAHYAGGTRHPNGTAVALGVMPSQLRFFAG